MLLVLLLMLARPLPQLVFAQEQEQVTDQSNQEAQSTENQPQTESTTSSPETPAPTQDANIQNEATVTNSAESTAESGENTITTPSPTPAITDTQPEPEANSSEPTGEENPPPDTQTTESTSEPTPEAVNSNSAESSAAAVIETGDAIAVTQVENEVNTTTINSTVSNQTLNVTGSQSQSLDISGADVASASVSEESNESTGSAVAVSNTHTLVQTTIDSVADTGNNTVESASSAAIVTGDTYSVVSLFNNVNTTIVDSVLQIFTINIFGSLTGNIILPEFVVAGTSCCGGAVNIDNSAQVTNIINSAAVSGQNSIAASGSALIVTGNAASTVNVLNLINQTFIDAGLAALWINVLGTWDGDFRGWNSFGETSGGTSLIFLSFGSGDNQEGCPTCLHSLSLTNSAQVTNSISSLAVTGGNSIQADTATIRTGDAASSVNLINLINTSFIRSLGFFGFINIFGSLEGDIGGSSKFPTATDSPESETQPSAGENSANSASDANGGPRENGGQLTITQANNVGAYVLPGDTVTFFVTIQNPGSGRVYDSQLYLGLFADGVDQGGVLYALGTIKPFGTVKFTTGLVLSASAAPGFYTAQAIVSGHVGAENQTISASADSSFLIAGSLPTAVLAGQVNAGPPNGEILGEEAALTRGALDDKLRRLLWLLLFVYFGLQAVRQRRELALTLYNFRLFL